MIRTHYALKASDIKLGQLKTKRPAILHEHGHLKLQCECMCLILLIVLQRKRVRSGIGSLETLKCDMHIKFKLIP